MKTIYKYQLAIANHQEFLLPYDAEILSVQVQYDNPQMWVLMDPNKTKVAWDITTIGTGALASSVEKSEFVDTYQMHDGTLVLHVFACPSKSPL